MIVLKVEPSSIKQPIQLTNDVKATLYGQRQNTKKRRNNVVLTSYVGWDDTKNSVTFYLQKFML